MTTTTTVTAVDRLLDIVTMSQPATPASEVFTADAVLDATVPEWRFQLVGEQIGHQLAEWFRDPGELEELERHATPTGEVVAYTVTWVENGVPHAARQVHVLTIVDDRIVRDQLWCGGRWSADLLAEMDVASR